MMFSHPQPEPFPPKRPEPPHPQPSLPLLQKQSRRSIHIMELHPHPLLLFVPHPQFVAVKSLIVLPPKFFLFMVYTMRRAWLCLLVGGYFGGGYLGGGRTRRILCSCPKDPLPLGVKRNGTKFEICRWQIYTSLSTGVFRRSL